MGQMDVHEFAHAILRLAYPAGAYMRGQIPRFVLIFISNAGAGEEKSRRSCVRERVLYFCWYFLNFDARRVAFQAEDAEQAVWGAVYPTRQRSTESTNLCTLCTTSHSVLPGCITLCEWTAFP